MATAKWGALGTEGSNIASTALDSLANLARSTGLTHDNSTNLDLRALVRADFGSFTPGTGGQAVLEVYPSVGGNVDDFGGSPYSQQTKTFTSGAGTKRLIFDVQLPPTSARLVIRNISGSTFAASGNALRVSTYNETVA